MMTAVVPETPTDPAALRRRLEQAEAELVQAREEAATWRRAALERWSTSMRETPTRGGGELALLRREVDELHRSASWRVTRPLRMAGTGARVVLRRR